LTATELRILEVLARAAGGVVTIEQILPALGRANTLGGRQALRAFVSDLRRKLESDPRRPDVLINDAWVGYRLVVEPGGPASLAANTGRLEGPAPARSDVRKP
jgi:two-component system, OmpR family, KDP operon response regulator KdpE